MPSFASIHPTPTVLFALLYTLVMLVMVSHAAPGNPVNQDYRWASPSAVSKWHDMKFGLRIHWGEYAITGIGPESWPLNRNAHNQTFLKWYWDQYRTWVPEKYDPDAWIALMKRSGVKFFDFTTKHHEGFSMYDTDTRVHDCWDLDTTPGAQSVKGIVPCNGSADGHAYSSMESSGRDITGELVAAARRGGIIPGLYFSNIDWYDASMRIDQWNPVASVAKLCAGQPCDPNKYNNVSDPFNWGRFVLRHRAQVIEVLTKYGEICEASFDMNFPAKFDQDMTDTIMLARQVAPNTLFRGRGMGGKKEDGGYGDYNTPEEEFPDKPIPGNWQVIYHGSNYMSYDPDASHYVNSSFIIWHLVDVVSKGGLMQIGYGPDRDGEFHPLAVQALEGTGRWLDTNGEAIYATHAMPLHWNDTASTQIRYTRSKDNSTIYAHALTGFGGPSSIGSTLTLACITLPAQSRVTLLGYSDPATRTSMPIAWENEGSKVTITVPTDMDKYPGVHAPGYVFKLPGATPKDEC